MSEQIFDFFDLLINMVKEDFTNHIPSDAFSIREYTGYRFARYRGFKIYWYDEDAKVTIEMNDFIFNFRLYEPHSDEIGGVRRVEVIEGTMLLFASYLKYPKRKVNMPNMPKVVFDCILIGPSNLNPNGTVLPKNYKPDNIAATLFIPLNGPLPKLN